MLVQVNIFTDGSARGNPDGPGGYGTVLQYTDERGKWYQKELSQGYIKTTNNRMELLAVIKGLEAIKWQNAEVHVVSDSSYVVNAINKGWLENWKRKGYAKVKNPDLWMRLVPLLDRHRVSFHWIKGHAGHPENERCDTLAVAAGAGAVAAGVALPPDAGYCPEEASLL